MIIKTNVLVSDIRKPIVSCMREVGSVEDSQDTLYFEVDKPQDLKSLSVKLHLSLPKIDQFNEIQQTNHEDEKPAYHFTHRLIKTNHRYTLGVIPSPVANLSMRIIGISKKEAYEKYKLNSMLGQYNPLLGLFSLMVVSEKTEELNIEVSWFWDLHTSLGVRVPEIVETIDSFIKEYHPEVLYV